MPVKTTHAAYDKHSGQWKRARDAVAGTDAVKAAGEAYLPMLKDQDTEDYKSYKKRATWFGASNQVVTGLTGMLFRRAPKVVMPDAVKEMLQDIDMAGTPLDVMMEAAASEVLQQGRIGLLVDHPPSIDLDGAQITLAQKESAGLRPTIQMYKTESILNWKHRRVKNVWALSMVVLEECIMVQDPKDEFSQKPEKRWRVLDLDPNDEYRQRVFRRNDKNDADEQVGGDVYPVIDGKRMNAIPFFPIGPNDVDINPEEPPLIDLFDLNFSHYRVSADYEHGCHFVGLPTPVITGYAPETSEDGTAPPKLYVGSSHAWVFPDPMAKAFFLEFHGGGLQSLETNMKNKETQMAILGSRMLVEDNKGRANESATASQVHRTGEASRLSNMARSIGTAIERALTVFCEWAGATGDIKYQLNRDYMPVGMDANTLASLTDALAQGKISFETYWEMLQRGDIGDTDVTADQEKERIKNNPEPVTPPLDPNKAPPADPNNPSAPKPKAKSLAPETKAQRGGA